MTALLQTNALTAFYGDAQALFGIDFEVHQGEMVAIIGANGAGKSTFMKALTGLVSTQTQQIMWKGQAIGGLAPSDIVKLGIALVPEGRRLFPRLAGSRSWRSLKSRWNRRVSLGMGISRSDRIFSVFSVSTSTISESLRLAPAPIGT